MNSADHLDQPPLSEAGPRTFPPTRQAVYDALLGVVLVLILSGSLLPLRPAFPLSTSLDGSWITAMSEAARQGLSLGGDVMFTYGPYAAALTHEYHPSTDSLMLLGSAILVLGLAAVLTGLGALRGRARVLLMTVLVLIVFLNDDAILLTYPWLLSLYVAYRYLGDRSSAHERPYLGVLLLVVMFVPLGLVPLEKGSTLVSAASASGLCAAALLANGQRREAAVAMLVPVVACALLWGAAGQRWMDLPRFFILLVPVITGYADAMSLEGPSAQVTGFIVAALVVVAAVGVTSGPSGRRRMFLAASVALALFVGFKSGFVRHDVHARIAGATIGIVAASLVLLRPSPANAVALAAAITAWVYIDQQQASPTSRETLVVRSSQLLSLPAGIEYRRAHPRRVLDQLLSERRRALAQQCPVDKMSGTTDVYTVRQSCLFYSDNVWDPRPVFQSYAAYTPALAHLNAEHLLGPAAPDNILFDAETIDGRLPALDDGPSWPLIAQLYQPRELGPTFLHLERRRNANAQPMTYSSHVTASPGQRVPVPDSETPTFARISLKPSIPGRLASALFKVPPPGIILDVRHKGERRYRLVPQMGEAGFILSPLIANTRDFLVATTDTKRALQTNGVTAFRIDVGQSGRFWSDDYDVDFASVRVPVEATGASKAFDAPIEPAPAGGQPAVTTSCDGTVDRLNDIWPAPMTLTSGPTLDVIGWTAASARAGTLADQTFVVVRSATATRFFSTRVMARPDVRDAYKHPDLVNAGYQAYLDLSDMAGDVTLWIAQMNEGRLTFCDPVRHIRVED